MTFHHAAPEHPHINYRHMPIRSLYELGRLVGEVRERLPEVRCPALVVQGTKDPTVDPRSAETIYKGLGTERKTLVMIPSERHGIVYQGIGDTHAKILEFLQALGRGARP